MNYLITYAALCHKGYIRSKNQDNLWCDGTFLQSENEGFDSVLFGETESKSFPTFAVFDGMGGEQQGEMAAYIAANHFDKLYKQNTIVDTKLFLLDACAKINTEICSYQKNNSIHSMGTTAAIIVFGGKNITVCNIGDSRIYLYNSKKMVQLSHDHCETRVTSRKPPLTQNLGIHETDFAIEPYIVEVVYKNNSRFLLCSDGLTDMVSDKDISQTLSQSLSNTDAAQALMNMTLSNGGVDNTTIIVCELKKQSRFAKFTHKTR